MKHAYTWGAILAIVLASTTGDVLLSRAMKQVGDVGNLWRRFGLFTVAARILRKVPCLAVEVQPLVVAVADDEHPRVALEDARQQIAHRGHKLLRRGGVLGGARPLQRERA